MTDSDVLWFIIKAAVILTEDELEEFSTATNQNDEPTMRKWRDEVTRRMNTKRKEGQNGTAQISSHL